MTYQPAPDVRSGWPQQRATGPPPPRDLRSEIEHALNRWSAENGSDTADFILAEYLIDCLAAFDRAVNQREKWYGRKP